MQLQQEMQRTYYAEQMRKALRNEPCSPDPVTQARIDEVVQALALGCTLRKPRMFRQRMMTAEDFQRIASKLTMAQVCIIVDALIKHSSSITNRTWYILGMLSRY